MVGVKDEVGFSRFVGNMNEWIQARYITSPRVNFAAKLPPELRIMIYQLIRLPRHHIVEHKVNPARWSNIGLLLVNHQLAREILALICGGCCFEFRHLRRPWNSTPQRLDRTDRAWWATNFLQGLGESARDIKEAKIVIEVNRPRSECYTPSIRGIVKSIDQYCSFRTMRLYRQAPPASIPITSVTRNPRNGKRCFQMVLPNQGNKVLTIEIQTRWRAEQPGTLAYATQLSHVREVFKSSIQGFRFRVGEFGDIMRV